MQESNPFRIQPQQPRSGGGVRTRGGPPVPPPPGPSPKIIKNMEKIKYKLAVLSGKGGVGKSFITASLAMALAVRGRKIGVLDMDYHGPSMPRMLGVKQELLTAVLDANNAARIIPAEGVFGIKVVSVDLILSDKTTPVVWRGAIKVKVTQQFLEDVEWGELDYLLIDMPPGTGDDALNLVQILPGLAGFIFVTIPSEVSTHVVAKSIRFVESVREQLGKDLKVVGVIENMSYFICDDGKKHYIFGRGGGERLSKALKTRLLGHIPLDPRIAESNDKGEPFFIKYKDSPAAEEFLRIADRVIEYIER